MEKEITLVTAFFRINRENWKNFERNDNVYFSYFEHWARIQNQLIVFVESKEHRKRVLNIRKKFGNESNTRVIIIDDIKEIDKELLKRISTACNHSIHQSFRIMPQNPEVIYPIYDYIMALKFWFLKEVVERKWNKNNHLAWIDFGFAHGSEVYPNAKEFDFTWKASFGDKLYFPALKVDDHRPIFDIVRTMDVYVMGCILVGSAEQWKKAWDWMREAECSLADCGMADDDQTILLMLSRKYPENIKLVQSKSWALFLKEHGASHLTVRKENNLKKIISKSKINFTRLKIHRFVRLLKYSTIQIKTMMKQ